MYDFYLGKTKLPVAPAKLSVQITGRNQTLTLINEGEINLLKQAGLTNISFEALLPNVKYPFSPLSDAAVMLDKLASLKNKPFQFIVARRTPSGKVLFNTNIKVSLENYKINEDARNGFDVLVDVNLKQYKHYAVKTVDLHEQQATITEQRQTADAPVKSSHTVVKGDSLWSIAQRYLGDGGRFGEIYNLNQTLIDNANIGTGNTKYTIHPKQTLNLPWQK